MASRAIGESRATRLGPGPDGNGPAPAASTGLP